MTDLIAALLFLALMLTSYRFRNEIDREEQHVRQ